MRPGQIVRSVDLEDGYPDTQIAVTYWDEWADEERNISFPLWHEIFQDINGEPDTPEAVSGVIYANVSER